MSATPTPAASTPSSPAALSPRAQATLAMLTAARAGADYFQTETGETYAELRASGDVLRLRSEAFRAWLDRAGYESSGALPSLSARREVLSALEGVARYEAPPRAVHVRMAEHAGAVFLDLGDATRNVVRVDALGWTVEARSPVPFARPRSLAAIPRPERGGSIESLRPFVPTLAREGFQLLIGWLLGALRPKGPHPILILSGEQGSGKSTLARFLKSLLDASRAPLRTLPRSERDLAITTTRAWIGVYDNLGPLSPAVSDALCRVSTGGGLGARKLFTDDDEVVFEMSRPLILTGIEDLATRPDLAERSIVLRLPPCTAEARRDEATLSAAFAASAPFLLGALLDGVASAMAGFSATCPSRLPRMADFARWVSAAEPALGWERGSFARAYEGYGDEASLDALDHDAVAPYLLRLPRLAEQGVWRGTATEMHEALGALAAPSGSRAPGWPRAPNTLAGHLRRIAPILRARGYRVTAERRAAGRMLIVERAHPNRSERSLP